MVLRLRRGLVFQATRVMKPPPLALLVMGFLITVLYLLSPARAIAKIHTVLQPEHHTLEAVQQP